ncbi:Site-specific tyrosine recombinase [Caballeronia sordidicola]|uniref:Site-specific tyrosine recombinase n=1 Tax=Caballeronia sordidicola TaxID=196367 RepID=A0A242MX38_CABSO|nr:Site-specific tyrosine recombinase [Caballeronia sordidicola]
MRCAIRRPDPKRQRSACW